MGQNWKEVKRNIHAAAAAMWFEEPEEVKMSRANVYPSGAGTGGQTFTNFYVQLCDTQHMGWNMAIPTMRQCLEDESFTLEQCQKLFMRLNGTCAAVLGSVHTPGCSAPWLNLPKIWNFYRDICACFDSMTSKADFSSLLWSWECLINRYNWWFWNMFPWELGQMKPRVDAGMLERLQAYSTFFDGKRTEENP